MTVSIPILIGGGALVAVVFFVVGWAISAKQLKELVPVIKVLVKSIHESTTKKDDVRKTIKAHAIGLGVEALVDKAVERFRK